MLNSVSYTSFLHWPQKEDETEKTAISNSLKDKAAIERSARYRAAAGNDLLKGPRPYSHTKERTFKLSPKIEQREKQISLNPASHPTKLHNLSDSLGSHVQKAKTIKTVKNIGKGALIGAAGLGLGYLAHKTFSKPSQEFIKNAQEKGAFINPISAIKPVTGNLARTAFGGAKNLLKDSWKGLSGIDKTLTVGLPLATTVPSLFNKKDQVGNSRANRLSSTAGNIIGGIGGTGLGNQLAKKVTTKLPGFAGKALGLGASVAGGLTGSLLGEAAAKTPFKAFNSSPTQSYNTQPSTSAPQMSMPGQTVS